MLIALVDFDVVAETRDVALEHLQKAAENIRAMSGNIAFRSHIDPRSQTHIGIIQEWSTEAAFDDYLASAVFADLGALLGPLMSAPPNSQRYRAEKIQA
jgi:quinol monooxygenase YgiN